MRQQFRHSCSEVQGRFWMSQHGTLLEDSDMAFRVGQLQRGYSSSKTTDSHTLWSCVVGLDMLRQALVGNETLLPYLVSMSFVGVRYNDLLLVFFFCSYYLGMHLTLVQYHNSAYCSKFNDCTGSFMTSPKYLPDSSLHLWSFCILLKNDKTASFLTFVVGMPNELPELLDWETVKCRFGCDRFCCRAWLVREL